MSISHVTAHYLYRQAESNASLSLRKDELASDETKDQLLDKLKNSFLSRLARRHGSFSTDAEQALLAKELDAFLQDKHSFSQLSTTLMQQFAVDVNEKDIEIKAHFLFFIDSLNEQHQVFYLFVVNHNESLAINDSLEVMPSYTVDTGPSMFGIKVDLAEWKVRQNYAYLSMLPPRGNPTLAETFTTLTGFADGIDTQESTAEFLKGVETFAKQLPEDKANDYRSQVVDYCMAQEKKDEPVNIHGLSKELDGIDCEKFVREVLPHNPGGEEEVILDRKSLRRYVKFFGRERDLSISFSTYHLNSRISYDEATDTLSIHGLPSALRKQLLDHLK
ncbi:MAG TPA: hypothetical protein ENJ41_07990 [Oceanospirillales bacterium]|nr:hypothetical protein [Oceanospirillales bacterium]